MADPELPPACLPGEEPLIDLETWDKAGRALVTAAPVEEDDS
ncbi:MAG: hypothetical protein OXH58_15180 [Acidimicrobiaceae bacterium]|nr:hypothetical protein [Acidimicrobiaceae bacterium]